MEPKPVLPEFTAGINPVDELAEEFAHRWRNGERPTPEEYVARYPQWGEDLREVLSALIVLEELKPQRATPPVPRPSLMPNVLPLERLGDFRILKEIGRGGMGIVYEAEQEALGRRVAIKVLPPQLVSEERVRQRFRREAQAAARLHHTNIVPVFGVGEQDGLCYYVMQLIPGQGMDRLRTRSDEPLPAEQTAPSLARLGLQVAEALAYAHAQGVLHRDVKPSNLLLDEHGTVWITDFGVARFVEGGNLTNTGELVGTLKYMPPECFNGQSDARGDIYSLGATLYELLARQSAFPDTTPHHLIQLISQGEWTPLRRIDPTVPRDLETIVHKALARDPIHRYQTAGDLADDLRCFVEDRPIQARRTTALGHVVRWCRRNRLVASLGALTVAMLWLVAIVSVVAYWRTAEANREAKQALEAEQLQRAQAEATSTIALQAMNRIYDRFAPNRTIVTSEVTIEGAEEGTVEVPLLPVLPREAAPLLEELLVFYEQLAHQGSDYAKLRPEAAEATNRIGDIRQRLGHLTQALAAYERAIALMQQLEGPGIEEAQRLKLARTFNELGRVHRLLEHPQAAREAHVKARTTLLAASPQIAKRPEYRFELARTDYLTARRSAGEPPPGLPPGLPGRRPPGPGQDSYTLTQVLRQLESLVKDYPDVRDYRHLLACCYRDQPPERPSGRFGPPTPSPTDRAIEILKALASEAPDVPDYRHDLCETYVKLADDRRFRLRDGSNEAEKHLRDALAIARALTTDYPNVPNYAITQARVHYKLGVLLHLQRKLEEAEKLLRRAITLQSSMIKRIPDTAANRFWLMAAQASLARLLIERDQWQEARTLITQLEKEKLRPPTERPPSDRPPGGIRLLNPGDYRNLAAALTRAGQVQLAEEANKKASQMQAEWPGPPGFREWGRGRN